MDQLNDNLREDAAVFVLGAMSDLEREAFRVKMMRNCELGRYVESLERVGDALLTTSPAVRGARLGRGFDPGRGTT